MRRRVILAVAAAALAAVPATASAAPLLRLADAGVPTRSYVTDGQRYVIGEVTRYGAPVRVVDLVNGRATSLDVPDDCAAVAIRRGVALFDCRVVPSGFFSTGRLVDLRTGAQTPLESIAVPPANQVDVVDYAMTGRAWSEVRLASAWADTPLPEGMEVAYIPRGSTDFEFRALGAHEQADLDLPGLVRPLCHGLERPRIPRVTSATETVLGPLRVVGRAAATVTAGDPARIVLQRCGRPPQTLQRCTTYEACRPPDLDDRFVAWSAEAGEGSGAFVRRLSGGTTLRTSADGLTGVRLVGHRLCGVLEERLRCSGPLAPLLPAVRRR